MRKIVFKIVFFFCLIFLTPGCQEVEELIPTSGNNLTALTLLTSDLIESKVTVEEGDAQEVIVIEVDVN